MKIQYYVCEVTKMVKINISLKTDAVFLKGIQEQSDIEDMTFIFRMIDQEEIRRFNFSLERALKKARIEESVEDTQFLKVYQEIVKALSKGGLDTGKRLHLILAMLMHIEKLVELHYN